MKISFITINYQSKFFLQKLLLSVKENLTNYSDFEFLILNNEKTSLSLKNSFPFSVKIIENKENLGFGKANNLGAKKALGEILIFINPDTLLPNDSILKMATYLENNPQIAIIGPKIIQFDRQAPQPWTCGKKTSLLNILFRNTIRKPWNSPKNQNVEWVSGACLACRKKDFEKIGGFDEKFFMYFEDQDLCIRMSQIIGKILFFPEAKIIHFEGKSWDSRQNQKSSFFTSQDYFFQKHHSKLSFFLLRMLRKIFKLR